MMRLLKCWEGGVAACRFLFRMIRRRRFCYFCRCFPGFLRPPAHLSARLTKTQLLIVTALSYHESFHMSQLAAYLSFSKEQATRAAAPLVEAGLIERFAQSENRTRVFLRLTAEGKTLADELRAQFSSQLKARVSASLSEPEQLELREAAETLVRLLSKI